MNVKQRAASLTLGTIGFFMLMSLSASAAWAQTATDLKCKGCVSSKALKKNAVKGNRIKDNAVTGAKIKDNSVGSSDILDGSLTGTDIQDDSIGSSDIANESLTGSDIQDGSIGSFDVADEILTGSDIQDDTIGSSDITDESLTGTDILNGSIGAADLGPGALGDAEDAVLYTRWGRSDCPAGATTVYSGIAGGGQHAQSGSGSNLLCLSLNPTWDVFNELNQDAALIYGAEYETLGYGLASVMSSLQDDDVPCAVCLREGADVMLMQPGRNICPASFATEYQGYLMASHYTQGASEFVCADRVPAAAGSPANQNGALLYPTEAQCGALPCGPGQYVQDRELTCSVCTR